MNLSLRILFYFTLFPTQEVSVFGAQFLNYRRTPMTQSVPSVSCKNGSVLPVVAR